MKKKEEDFNEIVKMYYEKVYNLTKKILKDKDSAFDATQEIFIKVYKNLNKFQGRSSIFTWIYRIAVNHCLNLLKKEKRIINEELDLEKISSPFDVEKEYENKRLKELIEKYLEKLAPLEKTVFLLYHSDGLKIKEICEVLKLKEGTIKSTLFNAHKKLAKFLERKI
ncbi:MAG: RNA polymerase sigma factor [candidate division WOR-3 bacterium]|nr:RNA polymerase sigma factor [candidate division WOR-3 bacterium]MCX7837315.1 RNA polymerase sigma factor [candidate division WOR-3 bacterium]MDW8114685.1 RNA polymerase sigma factor [candidate division WOR-3 bacterium]